MNQNKYQWHHIKDVDTLVPEYPKQGSQFYVVSLSPNPQELDLFMDQGYITTIPGNLLGKYRNYYVYQKQDWCFMPVEDYYLWLAALLTEGTDEETRKTIRDLRNQVEDLKARVAYYESYQARVRATYVEICRVAVASNVFNLPPTLGQINFPTDESV